MNPRQIIADVAREYLGLRETSTNRGPHFEEFWNATTYPEGSADRQPWCSAFATFCVREADRRSPLLQLRLPPKFPAVAQWLPWSRQPETGCLVFRPSSSISPAAGDIVEYLTGPGKLSHIGIVAKDYDHSGYLDTIEGNTNAAGSREGDGVFAKRRALTFAGSFIRVPSLATRA